MHTVNEIITLQQDEYDLGDLRTECASCAAHRPSPQTNGNLQVDPEIYLPSPGMDVAISYYYNSWASESRPYGFGRTISTNLKLIAIESPKSVKIIRGDGSSVSYVELEPEKYGVKGLRRTRVTINSSTNEWVETGPKGTKTFYPVLRTGAVSKVSRIVDSVGNCHSFSYDKHGLLTALTDAVGRQVTFHYNENDLLASILDWANRRTVFYYDTVAVSGKPLLTKVKGPTGCITKYEYDAAGYLSGIVDPNGYRTSYRYDDTGRVIARNIENSGDTNYTYYFANVASKHEYTRITTDALGYKTTEVFSDANELLSSTSPTGRTEVQERQRNGNSIAWFRNGRPSGATVRDQDKRSITKIDSLGLKTQYSYDKYGNLLTKTLPTGVKTEKIWGVAGSNFDQTGEKRRLQVEIDEYGNKTTHTYNGLGLRTSTTLTSGLVSRYAYDEFGNLVERLDSDGRKWSWTYDAAGNVIVQAVPDGGVTKIDYDQRNRVTKIVDPSGAVTKLGYDSNGNRTVLIDSFGNRHQWQYNVWDKVVASVSPLGRVSRAEYDRLGRMTARIDGSGARSEFAYDADGNIAALIDPLGNKTAFEYDADGLQTAVTDPLGNKTTTVFDEYGRPTATIDACGGRNSIFYDEFGRATVRVDALNNRTVTEYDKYGRMASITDALGNTTTIGYDDKGHTVAQTDASGNSMHWAYDTMGRIVSETDALSATTRREYNHEGRLSAVMDALGARTTFEYNNRGQRIKTTIANGQPTCVEFDAFGHKTCEIDPLGNHTLYHYDADGNLARRIDARENTTDYSYDGAGRCVNVAYSDGTEARVEFDAAGNRTRVLDGTGEILYRYDAGGNMTSVYYPDGRALTYTYDAVGRRVSLVDHNGTTSAYKYDLTGNLMEIQDLLGGLTLFEYNANGREIKRTFPSGMTAVRAYDLAGRETSRKYLNTLAVTLASYNAQFDNVGNLVKVVEANGDAVQYTYDATHQLTSEQRTGTSPFNTSHTYDERGNRLTRNQDGSVYRYEYNAANAISKTIDPLGSETSFAHDQCGNLISQTNGTNVTTFKWDVENRLINVEDYEGRTENHIYNLDGLRSARVVGGHVTTFVWDGVNVLAEINGDGTTRNQYIDAPGKWGWMIGQIQSGSPLYYAFDLSANTRFLFDSAENISAKFNYDAFGLALGEANAMATPYRYVGMYGYHSDTNERLYVRARHYCPLMGQWASRDPLGLAGGDFNVHRYVRNSVVLAVDPAGLWSQSGTATCFTDTAVFCNAHPENKLCPQWSLGMTGAWPNVSYSWNVSVKKNGHKHCCHFSGHSYNNNGLSEKVTCGDTITVSKGGCSVTITVIDAGPAGDANSGAIVDLHPAAAQQLYQCLYPHSTFSCGNFEISGTTVSG